MREEWLVLGLAARVCGSVESSASESAAGGHQATGDFCVKMGDHAYLVVAYGENNFTALFVQEFYSGVTIIFMLPDFLVSGAAATAIGGAQQYLALLWTSGTQHVLLTIFFVVAGILAGILSQIKGFHVFTCFLLTSNVNVARYSIPIFLGL